LNKMLKIPGYEKIQALQGRLGRVRTASLVFAATKLKTLAPTSYRPRVWRPQLASMVAIWE